MASLNDKELLEKISHIRELIRLEEQAESNELKTELSQKTREQILADGYLVQKLVVSSIDVKFNGRYQISLENSLSQSISVGLMKVGSVVNLVEHKDLVEVGKGIIHSLSDKKIQLIMDDLPNHLEGLYGLVLSTDAVTYKRMHFSLNQIESLIQKNDKSLLLNVLSRKNLKSIHLPKFKVEEVDNLNESQNKVVENILSDAAPLQLIHGPPGTGKTKTLVACVKKLVENGEKVLVCSGSNYAVDHLALELLSGKIEFVRMGHPSRMHSELHKFTLDEVIRSGEIGSVMVKMESELNQFFKTKEKRIAKEKWLSKQEFKEEKERIRLLKEDLKTYHQNAIQELNKRGVVFCSTCTGSASKEMSQLNFDTVIIDEAGQIISALVFLPLVKANRIIMAGDHLQLPPVIKSKEAEQKGLGRTFFEECVSAYPDYSSLLNIQYRMAEPIMGFSNQYFYDGKLQTHEKILSENNVDNELYRYLGDSNLVFIDTAGADFEEVFDPQNASRSNPKEAFAVKQICDEMMAFKISDDQIGVITPYKGQANCIKELMEEDEKSVEISTVDSFQGREKDIIIISLTRSNLDNQIGFLDETRRMNVAMTRAKQKLIIIGDSSTLSGHNFFEKIIEYFTEKGSYKSIWEFPQYME